MRSIDPLPEKLWFVRERAMQVIHPIKSVGDDTEAEEGLLFKAYRTEAGRSLPPYYLVYFLLVDLLKFKDLGKFEKVSWSVPIDFRGRVFLIEHRKLGLGIFARKCEEDEATAREIVTLIKKGVKTARPYFDYRAGSAVAKSRVNVLNNSSELYDRFVFLSKSVRQKIDEIEKRQAEKKVDISEYGSNSWRSAARLSARLRFEAKWLALSAIEAFFSWTEHVFIHLALLQGALSDAEQVASLAVSEWSTKYKAALPLSDPESKKWFDELLHIKKEVRNYVSHGAFGKLGEAFMFHSGAGAVSVLLPHNKRSKKYSLGTGLELRYIDVLNALDDFASFLWTGERAPARIYIQEWDLPVIMTKVKDGTYASAMTSVTDMEDYAKYLTEEFDRSANMEW